MRMRNNKAVRRAFDPIPTLEFAKPRSTCFELITELMVVFAELQCLRCDKSVIQTISAAFQAIQQIVIKFGIFFGLIGSISECILLVKDCYRLMRDISYFSPTRHPFSSKVFIFLSAILIVLLSTPYFSARSSCVI